MCQSLPANLSPPSSSLHVSLLFTFLSRLSLSVLLSLWVPSFLLFFSISSSLFCFHSQSPVSFFSQTVSSFSFFPLPAVYSFFFPPSLYPFISLYPSLPPLLLTPLLVQCTSDKDPCLEVTDVLKSYFLKRVGTLLNKQKCPGFCPPVGGGMLWWMCAVSWPQALARQVETGLAQVSTQVYCPLLRTWLQGRLLLTQNHRAKHCPLLSAWKNAHTVYLLCAIVCVCSPISTCGWSIFGSSSSLAKMPPSQSRLVLFLIQIFADKTICGEQGQSTSPICYSSYLKLSAHCIYLKRQ